MTPSSNDNPGGQQWRPNDMRLWTKDELIADIGRLEAWVDDRERFRDALRDIARVGEHERSIEALKRIALEALNA